MVDEEHLPAWGLSTTGTASPRRQQPVVKVSTLEKRGQAANFRRRYACSQEVVSAEIRSQSLFFRLGHFCHGLPGMSGVEARARRWTDESVCPNSSDYG